MRGGTAMENEKTAKMKKWWLIVICAVIGGVAAFCFSNFFITPQYTSTIKMYVNVDQNSTTTTYNDLNAAKKLVNTYGVILKTHTTLDDVIKQSGVGYTYEQISSMISTSSVDDTEVLKISVTCANPDDAHKIAETIGKVLPVKIAKVVNGSAANVVDFASVPDKPTSPNIKKNSALGFIGGCAVALVIILLLFFFNDKIDSEEKLIAIFGENIPVLSVIPDVNAENHSKRGYYYYTSSNNAK